jgi:hypothetical protein
LAIFLDDLEFYPKSADMGPEFNPSHDPQKVKTLKIESAWEWRSRVLACLRCQDELYDWETPRRGSYPSESERDAFYMYFQAGRWNQQAGWAIVKINRLMEEKGVYWE